jgi:hypothetical protein
MLIKRQTEPDRRKPELKVFSFYSQVAKELGINIADVDLIYADYIDQVMEALPGSNKLVITNLGEFRVNPRKLRVTFFKRVIYMCDLLLDPEYPKREQRTEKCLRILKVTLDKMIKDFEFCTICNKREHVSYMCVRNVVGNLYYNVDRISHLTDEVAQNAISTLKEMYDHYAPRIIAKADELGSVEFASQYKDFMLKINPDLAERWGKTNTSKEKFTSRYLSIDELEQIYIPEYDIRYYL